MNEAAAGCVTNVTTTIQTRDKNSSNQNADPNTKATCSGFDQTISPQTQQDCARAGMYWSFTSNACYSSPPSSDPSNYCGTGGSCNPTIGEISNCNGSWDCSSCECLWGSPIIIDVQGNGFTLTDSSNGVDFDLILGQTLNDFKLKIIDHHNTK